MRMPRGLRKLNAVANTLQAWEDFEKLACQAVDLKIAEHIIIRHTPAPQDSWRKIDKCIASLRVVIQQAETLPERHDDAIPVQSTRGRSKLFKV